MSPGADPDGNPMIGPTPTPSARPASEDGHRGPTRDTGHAPGRL